MNFSSYTSDFDNNNSCSYFFFSNEDDATEGREKQRNRDLKESLNKSLTSISTYWCYMLITDYVKGLNNPAIIDKETKQAFNGPETIWLNGIG